MTRGRWNRESFERPAESAAIPSFARAGPLVRGPPRDSITRFVNVRGAIYYQVIDTDGSEESEVDRRRPSARRRAPADSARLSPDNLEAPTVGRTRAKALIAS